MKDLLAAFALTFIAVPALLAPRREETAVLLPNQRVPRLTERRPEGVTLH